MRRLVPLRVPSLARTPVLLTLASTCLFALFQQGSIVHADSEEVYQLTRALVEHGRIALDVNIDFPLPGEDNIGSPGRDGEVFSRYGIGLSLLALIPYLLALPFSALLGHEELIQHAAVASLMPLICGLLVAAIFGLARRLGASDRAAVLVGLGSVLGTFVLPYTKEFFSEPLTALLMVVMLERAIARNPLQAGMALAAAGLVRPQVFAFAPVLVLMLLLRSQRGWRPSIAAVRAWEWGAAIRAGVPVALAVAFNVLYNKARFDSFLSTGYETDEGFTTPIRVGTEGLLADPEKSIFLFAPVVVLVPLAAWALRRRCGWAVAIVVAQFLVTFFVTATWSGWDGDWAWGPRLLIPGLIPMLALVGPWVDRGLHQRRAALALFATGLLVSASVMVVPMQTQQRDEGVLSPRIVRQVELIGPTVSYTADHLDESPSRSLDHRSYVSTWQVLLARELGVGGFVFGVLATLPLAALCALLFLRLRRSLGDGVREPRPAAPV